MFDYYDPPEDDEDEPTDYSGLTIGLCLVPVFILVTYLANADIALGTDIVLGAIIFAIKMRWYLRKHIWFWAVIALILVLHVPLVFMFRLPEHTHVPTREYVMPIGILDFFIIIVALDTADKLFSRDSSSDGGIQRLDL